MTTPTYRHLLAPTATSTSNAFRTIAHVDVDAAYCGFEMSRLGISSDIPFAVQQWQGLIAVNYAARAFGITRHESPSEALKKCPALVLQHVATYRNGDTEPGYWEGDDVKPETHKVSLDPYRREGAKIVAVFSEFCDVVEKASIDESYLDLTVNVKSLILTRYPTLASLPEGQTIDSALPTPAELGITIQWNDFGNVIPLRALDDQSLSQASIDAEERIVTWSDVALSLGAEIVAKCRAEVESRLGYTVSAGLAQNKVLAKLCSAWKKPNAQTILRPLSVASFLRPLNFTKIRGFGGKLGAQVTEKCKAETVGDLLDFTIDELQERLGSGAGLFVWEIARGIDNAEVEAKTATKSMLSSKNFKPAITTLTEANHWLNILSTELHLRLTESRANNTGIWPKTICFSHRSINYVTKSHSVAFPFTNKFTISYLYTIASKLLRVAILADMDGRKGSRDEEKIGPYSNMQLTFSGLESGEDGQKGIETFFSAASAPSATAAPAKKRVNVNEGEDRAGKRRKEDEEEVSLPTITCSRCAKVSTLSSDVVTALRPAFDPVAVEAALERMKNEHEDYHFGRDLLEQELKDSRASTGVIRTGSGTSGSKKGKAVEGKKKTVGGQTSLQGFFKRY